MGDGVLAYFGYPQAHEDDAERAVRAGLDLVVSVRALKPHADTELECRVGVATGLVVVGDLIGSGAAQEQAVVGETPNLAARLQALARPSTVVIAASTRRLLGGLFDYEDLGAVEVKGYTEPVAAWRVRGRSATESRYEALHAATGITPLVGRDEEIELLLRRWQRAKSGDGQVVLLSGEPGIGKSRITAALQERLHAEPLTWLRYFCSPDQQESPLHPIIAQLERACAIKLEDSPETKLDKLVTLLAPASPPNEDVALLAELLSIPITDRRYPPLTLTPQRKKEKTFEALLRQLEAPARRRPVLMVFEDVHWIDPTTLELLSLTVDRAASSSVLILVTFRPEFQPPWTGQPHVTVLTLARLDRRDGEALVERITGNSAVLPSDIVTEIVERTDGVPLFVEELTKAVLEAGAQDSTAKAVLSVTGLPSHTVPATLHASLMARLDRLGPAAKEIAQIGAAIGREFSYELLAAVTPDRPDAELQIPLDRLVAAGLVLERGVPPNATFLFKHALVQDAAYGMLLRSRRQQLHERIAVTLEDRFREISTAQPSLLAQHCAEGGLTEKAVVYWDRAGQRALSRFALTEAIAHLTKALALLRDLPPTNEHKQQELRLQIELGGAFIAAKGYGASETGQAFARACDLGREMTDAPQLFQALAGMFVHHHVRAEVGREQEAARELLRLAEEQDNVAGQVMAHRALGDSLLHVGHLSSAHAHLERALSLFGPDASPVIIGEEIGVAALSFLSLCLVTLGFPGSAATRSQEALERARGRVRHPHTLAFALACESRLQYILRNRHRLRESADELSSLAAEHGLKFYRARGAVFRGYALMLAGRLTEAVPLLEEGIAGARATGAVWQLPLDWSVLATAYQRIGRLEEARSLLEEALELGRRTGVEWAKAELHRLEAELALSAVVPNPDLAEASLRKAIATAQQQGAKWRELRAATSLARLWRDQGKHTKARDLLAPVYGWFTEGFDTPDLVESRALLDELITAPPPSPT
jgi:predicted ATPase